MEFKHYTKATVLDECHKALYNFAQNMYANCVIDISHAMQRKAPVDHFSMLLISYLIKTR